MQWSKKSIYILLQTKHNPNLGAADVWERARRQRLREGCKQAGREGASQHEWRDPGRVHPRGGLLIEPLPFASPLPPQPLPSGEPHHVTASGGVAPTPRRLHSAAGSWYRKAGSETGYVLEINTQWKQWWEAVYRFIFLSNSTLDFEDIT